MAVTGPIWASVAELVESRVTVAVGLLAYSTAPVFASLLEPWWFREPFSRRALAASLLTVGGIVLMVPRWEAGEATLLGSGWGVLAGASFALLSQSAANALDSASDRSIFFCSAMTPAQLDFTSISVASSS